MKLLLPAAANVTVMQQNLIKVDPQSFFSSLTAALKSGNCTFLRLYDNPPGQDLQLIKSFFVKQTGVLENPLFQPLSGKLHLSC